MAVPLPFGLREGLHLEALRTRGGGNRVPNIVLGRALVVATAVNANPVLIFSSSLSSVARREQDFSPAGAGRRRGGVRSRRARGIAAPRLTHTLLRVVWDETTGAASCPLGTRLWVCWAQEDIFGVYGMG